MNSSHSSFHSLLVDEKSVETIWKQEHTGYVLHNATPYPDIPRTAATFLKRWHMLDPVLLWSLRSPQHVEYIAPYLHIPYLLMRSQLEHYMNEKMLKMGTMPHPIQTFLRHQAHSFSKEQCHVPTSRN